MLAMLSDQTWPNYAAIRVVFWHITLKVDIESSRENKFSYVMGCRDDFQAISRPKSVRLNMIYF